LNTGPYPGRRNPEGPTLGLKALNNSQKLLYTYFIYALYAVLIPTIVHHLFSN